MRTLYSIVWWIILPFALLRIWIRGKKEPGYREHVLERLGFFPPLSIKKNSIWVHAVSVGETRAALPLIEALLSAYPQKDLLLTCMTATGRATGYELLGQNPRVMQAFLPYDIGSMMHRLISHFSPSICILMETEVWPNLIFQCQKSNIPVALVNARLSERSLKKGKKAGSLITSAASGITTVAAQTETDAIRLRHFGSAHVNVVGSVKFDVSPKEEALIKGKKLRALIGERPVLMCASTRDGEELLILEALDSLMPKNTLLLLVPRHPQRFNDVADFIQAKNKTFLRRSTLSSNFESDQPISPDTQILLGDSMGEMFCYYSASDLAFIGGSLKPLGGQNLIEACAVGTPVLIGEHSFNFEAITEDAIKEGVAFRIHDAKELFQKAAFLLSDLPKCYSIGEKAKDFARTQKGATEKTLAQLKPFIDD